MKSGIVTTVGINQQILSSPLSLYIRVIFCFHCQFSLLSSIPDMVFFLLIHDIVCFPLWRQLFFRSSCYAWLNSAFLKTGIWLPQLGKPDLEASITGQFQFLNVGGMVQNFLLEIIFTLSEKQLGKMLLSHSVCCLFFPLVIF